MAKKIVEYEITGYCYHCKARYKRDCVAFDKHLQLNKEFITEHYIQCQSCKDFLVQEKINVSDKYEDDMELAYWYFDSIVKKGNLSERDCFKMAIRRMLNKSKEQE